MFHSALEFVARFFTTGGPFMWLILLLFAAAVAVIVERSIFFYRTCRTDVDRLMPEAMRLLNENRSAAARRLVERKSGPLNRILSVAIGRYGDGLSLEEVRKWVEEVAIQEVPRFGRRINYLAMFANIATLTGLLGTIFGLQRSFGSLAVAEAAEKAAMLAAGISQAMNTTAFGLIVAIPCLIAYAKLSNLQAARTEEMDACTVRLLNYLESKREADSWIDESSNVERLVSQDSAEAPLSANS